MQRIFSSEHGLMIEHLKDILEEENIECMIKNQNLSGGVGEIPPIECWPELWVIDDEDFPKAKEIVGEVTKPSDGCNSSWLCQCGEKIEGQFTDCWNCGKTRV